MFLPSLIYYLGEFIFQIDTSIHIVLSKSLGRGRVEIFNMYINNVSEKIILCKQVRMDTFVKQVFKS